MGPAFRLVCSICVDTRRAVSLYPSRFYTTGGHEFKIAGRRLIWSRLDTLKFVTPLSSRKARGEAVKPWAFLADNEFNLSIVPLYEAARTYFQENFLTESRRTEKVARPLYQMDQPEEKDAA